MKLLALLSIVIIFSGACSQEPQRSQDLRSTQADLLLCEDMGGSQCEVHKMVNQERAYRGLSPLSPSFSCSQAAQAHAEDMDLNNYFSHNGFVESWGDRMDRFGLSGLRAENIAVGINPESVVDLWMSSEGHRNNILNPELKYTGVGLSGSKWVQCFSSSY